MSKIPCTCNEVTVGGKAMPHYHEAATTVTDLHIEGLKPTSGNLEAQSSPQPANTCIDCGAETNNGTCPACGWSLDLPLSEPANTSEELQKEIVKIVFHPLSDNPLVIKSAMGTTKVKMIMQLIADHDKQLYTALEAQKEWTERSVEVVPIEAIKGVFNMKEEADGDSK